MLMLHFQNGLAWVSGHCWYTQGPRLKEAPSHCASMISKAGTGYGNSWSGS